MRALLPLLMACHFVGKDEHADNVGALYGDSGGPDESGDPGASCDAPVEDPASLDMASLDDVTEAAGVILGGYPYAGAGYGVAGLGDVDGDGLDDVAVGHLGGVVVWFEAPTGERRIFDETWDYALEGEVQAYGWVGYDSFQPVRTGDLDGDGHDDLLLTADHGYPPEGYYNGLFLLEGPISSDDGSETTTLLDTPFFTDMDAQWWRASVTGDLDGDDAREILAVGSAEMGGVLGLISGAGVGTPCTDTAGCAMGVFAVDDMYYDARSAGAGDTTGDGVPDVVLGAPYADGETGIGAEGRVWVLDGQELGGALSAGALVVDPADAILVGDYNSGVEYVGYAVAGLGDIDEDGLDDVLVAAPGGYEGRAWALLDGGARRVELSAPEVGDVGNKRFAERAIAAGDVNGDCVPDVVVGAPAYQDTDGGAIFVYLGGTAWSGYDTVDPSIAATLPMPTWTDTTQAMELVAAGDPDGDGYGDLLVGNSSWEMTGDLAGQGVVWYVRGGP